MGYSKRRASNGGSDKCDGIPMDSLITAAARALAAGDPLGALKRVALRDDAPSLALRGIAMAQLGDHVRAKALLRSAARAFGPKEAVARARCVVAEAEIQKSFSLSAPRPAPGLQRTAATRIWRPGRPAADPAGSPTAPCAGGSPCS